MIRYTVCDSVIHEDQVNYLLDHSLFRRKMASSSQCRFGCQCTETLLSSCLPNAPSILTVIVNPSVTFIASLLVLVVPCIPTGSTRGGSECLSRLLLVDDISVLSWPMDHNTWYFNWPFTLYRARKGFSFPISRADLCDRFRSRGIRVSYI